MKIDLSLIDLTNFMVHNHAVGDETVFLVQPQFIGAKWSTENKIFRSSVWNAEGEPVSLGFPKFVNWGENPDVFPVPTSLDRCQLVEKLDGSLLIVSRYKGRVIARTRGTLDARKLDNGFEIDILQEKYPMVFDPIFENRSLLLEWVSPIQRIVLDYGPEPDLFLVGAVSHVDYSLLGQIELDILADELGVKRPKYFKFDSIPEMLTAVDALKGQEGICCYSRDGQSIFKIKAAAYLAQHRFKSHANIETVIDLFCEWGCPDYAEFSAELIKKFDWEIWNSIRGFVSQVCDAWKEVARIKDGMLNTVDKAKLSSTRKEQAMYLKSCYGETSRLSMAFSLLDGKPLNAEQHKKLIYQVLKKI